MGVGHGGAKKILGGGNRGKRPYGVNVSRWKKAKYSLKLKLCCGSSTGKNGTLDLSTEGNAGQELRIDEKNPGTIHQGVNPALLGIRAKGGTTSGEKKGGKEASWKPVKG